MMDVDDNSRDEVPYPYNNKIDNFLLEDDGSGMY